MKSLMWSALLALMMTVVNGDVLFSTLQHSLVVSAQVQNANNHAGAPQAGKDHVAIQWSLNSTFAGQDSRYSKVVTHLCFGPPSQVNRGWRKTNNDLSIDKTCSAATIATQPYTSAGNSTVWLISREVPKADYFVRAYATDATGLQLAFGQSTNTNKTTNLFPVDPISGRSTSIDIASAMFSIFAVGSFLGYLGLEKLINTRKERRNGMK